MQRPWLPTTGAVGNLLLSLDLCGGPCPLPSKLIPDSLILAGCDSPANDSPMEGDVRLVPLNGTTSPTAACDDVHFGGVEIFHDGRWGRICSDRFGTAPADFTLDAQVVCRQLGFPYGGVMDAEEVFRAYDGQEYDYSDPRELVWATEVRQ